MEASVRDLRYKTKEILTIVSKNQEVIITKRGKKIARIVPLKQEFLYKNDIGFGMWKNRKDMKNIRK